MARGKVHPLEKAWKKTFEKFRMPYWLPWYSVELKRIPEGIEVGGLKVKAVDDDEMLEAARGVVCIINEQGWKSPLFVAALVESVGSYAPISAHWFNLMAGRWFYPDKKMNDIDEEDRVDEKGRPIYIETSKGLMVMDWEERDYIDEENRKVEIDEEGRASASREER